MSNRKIQIQMTPELAAALSKAELDAIRPLTTDKHILARFANVDSYTDYLVFIIAQLTDELARSHGELANERTYRDLLVKMDVADQLPEAVDAEILRQLFVDTRAS